MHGEGWRRLWELMKWLASIGIGLFVAFYVIDMLHTAVLNPSTPQPTAGQIVTGGLFAGGIVGSATFGLLYALEWVYRGFRPLPVVPTESIQMLPKAQPDATQEQPLALGHQEAQQGSSVSPTPLQEPTQQK